MRKMSQEAKDNIIRNLRSSQENLKPFTDEQILNAYDNWSMSEDYPNEELIVDWIDSI